MRELYPSFDGSQLCRQFDPEFYFPEYGMPVESRLAKQMCHGCPFKAPCLEYAMAIQVWGIWGGTTEAERRRIRKRTGQVAVPIRVRHGARMKGPGSPSAPAGQDQPVSPTSYTPQGGLR